MQARNPARSTELDALNYAELVPKALQRDDAAYRLIMQRHYRRLYRCARAIVRDDNEAEDTVQASVNAFGKRASFRGDSSLAAWLTRITLNEALGRVRRRRLTVELTALDGVGGDQAQIIPVPLVAAHTDPERSAARREIRRLIERSIDGLPEPFRVVFVVRDVEDVSIEVTAELLGLRPATVQTRLHRPRRLLRRALDEQLAATLSEAFPCAGMAPCTNDQHNHASAWFFTGTLKCSAADCQNR